MSETAVERRLREMRRLVKKWRNEADGVAAMGYFQQAERMTTCADELAALLARCEGETQETRP